MRRRHFWLLAPIFLWACSDDDDDDGTLYRPVTAIKVTPAAFLGDQACRAGGLERYQATLIDVTFGLDGAFTLPSSRIISCNSAVSFEFVEPGQSYMATIAAFDRTDIKAQNPGSPVIVDSSGKSVVPRYTTTCWGDDRIDYSSVTNMGGTSGEEVSGEDGAGGEIQLGVVAYEDATTTVRGCDPLTDTGKVGPTGVTIDIEPTLLGLECGAEPGQVDHFTVYSKPPLDSAAPAEGGAGGTGGASPAPDENLGTAKCGEVLTIQGLTPSQHTSFFVNVFSAGESSPSWNTTCVGLTVPGVIVDTSCDPISNL